MNITLLSEQYPKSPNFNGHSRQIQTQLDKILNTSNLPTVQKDEFISLLKKADITRREKFIEEGSHNAVYKITRKYAARVPIGWEKVKNDWTAKLSIGKQIFSNLKNYFGEPIVELDKFQILHNVGRHLPAGVPEHLSKSLSRNRMKKYYLNTYLKKFASIPQSSYDNFAQDMARLNDIKLGARRYCVFDYLNPNNVVLRKGKLYLVDEIDTNCDKSYANTSAKLLNVFINRLNRRFEAPNIPDNKTALVRKIFKKVVLASNKAGLLHADTKEDYAFWQTALKKCRIKEEPYNVLNTLEEIESRFPVEKRTEKINNYLNSLFFENHINR